jgi:hypothetical protein
MTLPVVFTQSAKDDLRSARDWYEKESAGLGHRFMEDVLAVFGLEPAAVVGLRQSSAETRMSATA